MSNARQPARSTDAHNDPARSLARMRAIATGVLIAMSGVFIASRSAPARWIWPPYLAAFAEAAMVGGLADWFAVTALFRRPLGLPIPHTAIVPRNKDRIGRALGDFIAGSFLTPRLLDARLRRLDPAARLAAWLTEPGSAGAVAGHIASFAPDLTASNAAVREFAGQILRRGVMAAPAAPIAGRLAAFLVNDGRAEAAIERLIAWLAALLAAEESAIRAKISEKSWRWLPRWVDHLLAGRIIEGLASTLAEMRDTAHPWRIEIRQAVDRFIHRLGVDETLIARGEALKLRIVDDPEFGARMTAVWDDVSQRLAAGDGEAILAPAIERALIASGRWLASDPLARERLNGLVRVALRRLVAPQREAIGGFVAQVVAGWDAREAAARLELQVGADLQYIRISGALVGGLAGLTIYCLVRLFGLN